MADSGWMATTIGEQATLQRGIDITKASQRPGKVPVVSSGGISSYHDTSQVSAPGVVLGRKGVVGSVYYITEDYWPHDTTLWVKDFHSNDPRFVYYFFKSLAPRIARMDVGSANPTLNRNHVHPIKVMWPPLDEQKAIAHILGTLDDKIELTQQMNRTLEGIARALFKSWFIDFDPVRAKLDGRQPSGMDAETAALFPDAFEDGGAIGPIPQGWAQCNLGDFLNLKRGYDLPKRLREEGNVPIISSSGLSDHHSTPKVKAPGVITGRYGTVGQVFFIEEDFWPLNTTLYVQDFKGNNPKIAYYILEQMDFNVYADKAAVPGVNRNHVHQEKIIAPPKQIQERFFQLLEPTWQQQTVNEQEAGTLRDLRDTLLPKLLSGKIHVKAAEQALEVVA
jgi:type I restriction enzyme S subunit